ncbi:hypothetical protein CPB86DRAFT_671594, partial [Serendipita vermifera]
LGKTFVDVLKRYKIERKVGQVTGDNAGNNGTMTETIESALCCYGILFSHSENRIRCFPHVINLAVQDFLDAIGKI